MFQTIPKRETVFSFFHPVLTENQESVIMRHHGSFILNRGIESGGSKYDGKKDSGGACSN
ncbi:MAG TPA: hypothetical protein VJB37_00875 [Patescibacteria group bacterium]|nr:hypothetical protein [Patescibacteria group bacterium]